MKKALVRCGGCFTRRWRDRNDDATTNKRQTFIAMKLLLLLTAAAWLQTSARGYGQTISLDLQNVSLEKAFIAIEKESGYHFVYLKEQVANSKPVTIQVKNAALQTVLELCFAQQPLTYSLSGKYISVKEKEVIKEITVTLDIRGKVINENGEPVAGATVQVKGQKAIITTTNNEGEFLLKGAEPEAILIVSGAEMETEEIKVNGREVITIKVKTKVNDLDQVVIMAYGQTTKRLNTGNISKVTSEEISKQPVTNPLATLAGRVPGLLITQSSGLNGAAFKVEIRGQNSLLQGSEPYYIIDGVPFAPGNAAINQLTNAASSGPIPGLSPFALLDPANIESIEILKDADATAIYGSRGANGVILITTKKGKAGKTKLQFRVHNGASKVTRTMDMLGLNEYLAMRREGFANDGVTPTTANAPDLLLWDTTRYTDMKKLLIGGTARNTDAQMSLSGGSGHTQFRIGAGYHRQTTVFPTDLADKKASVHFSINHNTPDKRLQLNFSGQYLYNKNQLTVSDLTRFIRRPPNFKIFDINGGLNWEEGGVPYINAGIIDANPFSFLYQKYNGQFHNIIGNSAISYALTPALQIKTNIGYNIVFSDELSTFSSQSIDPYLPILPNSRFANSHKRTWIIEPQAEYKKNFKKGTLTLLFGTTWQENRGNGTTISASDYSNDIFLNTLAGAGSISASNTFSQYRYTAFFGRLNFNGRDKYILNLTGRRDGSSRFGPANRFSHFGAAGAGWVFSKESFARKLYPVISFGKLRMSYGITGNDQIGDYKFIDTWTASSTTYTGTSVLNPTALFNPDYAWEVNRKAESAVELGFFKDRLLLTVSYFSNRCGNQLVNYTLPIQTGFNSIGRNLDALIANKGIEIQLAIKSIIQTGFSWNSSFNMTIYRNKLLAFPGLASSSYANTYFIGQSLSTRRVYHYLRVNPATGIYEFEDADRNGTLNSSDKNIFSVTDPRFYGGWQNSFSFRGLQLDVFFEYRKQKGRNYITNLETPGYSLTNQPKIVLNRWQQAGDITDIQRFTASPGPAFTAVQNFLIGSDAGYTDASFIRCKNISLAYHVPVNWLKKLHGESAKIYVLAQNVFTLTKYAGADPENQNMFILPPLKTITAGFSLDF